MKETSISRERALAILKDVGRADEYDPLGDYYLATDDDGQESLTTWGQDEPLAVNRTTTSWA